MTKTTNASVLPSVTLNAITNSSQYTQSNQTSDIEFSILNRINDDSFRELHYQVKCREYLGDTNVAARLDVDTPQIYGFRLVGERMPLNESLFSLSVKEESYNNIIRNIKIINDLEKDMKILKKDRSKLFDTGIYDSATQRRKLVLVGPSDWMKSPLTVSLYTFMIRILTYKQCYDRIEDYLQNSNISGTDASYMLKLKELDVRFLLKNIDEVLGENPISGINDHDLLESTTLFRDSGEERLKYTWDNEEHLAYYGIWRNHSESGFVSFWRRVGDIEMFKSKGYDWNYLPIGSKWSLNYSVLLENRKKVEVKRTLKRAKSSIKEQLIGGLDIVTI